MAATQNPTLRAWRAIDVRRRRTFRKKFATWLGNGEPGDALSGLTREYLNNLVFGHKGKAPPPNWLRPERWVYVSKLLTAFAREQSVPTDVLHAARDMIELAQHQLFTGPES